MSFFTKNVDILESHIGPEKKITEFSSEDLLDFFPP